MKRFYYINDSKNLGIKNVLSYYAKKEENISLNVINENYSNIICDESSYILLSVRTLNEFKTILESLDILRQLYDFKFKIILGGAALYFINLKELMKYYAEINYIVIGRGEEVFENIVYNNLSDGIYYDRDFDDIKYYTLQENFILDVDEIQISFDGNECLWSKCEFCSLPSKEKYKNSVRDIFSKIMYYRNFGIKKYAIIDNYLNIKKFILLLSLLISEGLTDISFDIFGVHVNTDINLLKPYINKFNNLFGEIGWGLEFLDNEILDIYKKGISMEKIEKSINTSYDLGIPYSAFLLLGLPLVKQKNIEIFYNNIEKLDNKIFHYKVSYFDLSDDVGVFNNKEYYKIKLLNKIMIKHNNINFETNYYNFLSYYDGKYIDRDSTFDLYDSFYRYIKR